MESTGVYWIPPFELLESLGFTVYLVNAQHVQNVSATAPQMDVPRVELSTLDLQPLGDGASEIGRATLTLAGGQRVSPRYVMVWKQEDGVWRRRLDIWSMDKA
jgi:hypothetical protein